ncbi:1-aminocyclopropane-1-carboxylate oxidase homolog 1-like [Hibiscus syriacus]|uniref:1-aminocyclopropane-1-carboxylate oxidase homolog 1-like n=1 Tax=Hibiscus syriacus TaxID=106335 RepID=UPI001922C18D|nr:1-aminocyclopropane-1-carboxylate oxidase homolog 1-like [Hibiscus syriacus]
MAEMETSPRKEEVDDVAKAVKALEDTKAGIQGLVDTGIVKLPPFFFMSPDVLNDHPTLKDPYLHSDFQVPVIDLKDVLDPVQHKEIVEKMRSASEEWGFFQVINHGIPQHVLKEAVDGVRRFHEQPRKVKTTYYGRTGVVRYYTNYALKSKGVSWIDTLACVMAPNPTPEKYPSACRDIFMEYSKHVESLGEVILGLLSEALCLDPEHLKDIGCSEGYAFHCQYYPACPEPDRTLGVMRHRDPDFFTILVQNEIQGLQVLHRDHWIDISPMKGAVIVNIGDLLQLISNDKFKSVDHRVLATSAGPRVSLACLFTTDLQPSDKVYAPIEQLLSPHNPPLYKGTTIPNYLKTYVSKPGNGLSLLKL